MSTRAACVLAALSSASCTTIARPPVPGADDVDVVLVNEACHKGLDLPSRDGARVEWGFGDFDWYALERNEWYRALGTALVPSRGTLGRRVWDASEESRRGAGDCTTFRADRARVARLAESLERAFDAARSTRVWNANYATEFVIAPESYWLFHDCHDATAEWLTELSCDVEPALVRLDLALWPRPEVPSASQ